MICYQGISLKHTCDYSDYEDEFNIWVKKKVRVEMGAKGKKGSGFWVRHPDFCTTPTNTQWVKKRLPAEGDLIAYPQHTVGDKLEQQHSIL